MLWIPEHPFPRAGCRLGCVDDLRELVGGVKPGPVPKRACSEGGELHARKRSRKGFPWGTGSFSSLLLSGRKLPCVNPSPSSSWVLSQGLRSLCNIWVASPYRCLVLLTLSPPRRYVLTFKAEAESLQPPCSGDTDGRCHLPVLGGQIQVVTCVGVTCSPTPSPRRASR